MRGIKYSLQAKQVESMVRQEHGGAGGYAAQNKKPPKARITSNPPMHLSI
jgi:hypothetical protein